MADTDRVASELLDALKASAAISLEREFDRVWLRSLRQQAEFGCRRLNAELSRLDSGANLLEIGGGPFLLSMIFAARGYRVVTLEPRGSGFEHLRRIQDAILSFCEAQGIRFEVVDRRIEDVDWQGRFDLAFSVNVFEHIDDVELGLRNSVASLREQGALRVLCANYSFPYEPHFGIPVVINKDTTGALFSRRIAKLESEKQSPGLWDSLNFISVRMLRRLCARHGWGIAFDGSVTLDMLKRFQFDESLRRRHAPLAPLVDFALKIGVGRLVSRLPAPVQPYMDARVTKHREAHS